MEHAIVDVEVWQQLSSLESRDAVDGMFNKIHGRELTARRSKEISASARQAREYFRSADEASLSVRPLLTFYGVSSLSRSLTLLLRKHGGEEGLARGHGLETVDWSKTLSGDLSTGLAALGALRVRKCAGTFSDLIDQTRNIMCIHVRSGAVDWRIGYPVPQLGHEICLDDILARSPDLRRDYIKSGAVIKYSSINEMSYSSSSGFNAKIYGTDFVSFQQSYLDREFMIEPNDSYTTLTASSDVFSANIPQFAHTYVQKDFGMIPSIHIAEMFPGGGSYSQLSVVYLTSYFLGMLARYFPTYWTSLIFGEKGDVLWPTLNRAQHMVERAFPEIVSEFITDVVSNGLK